MMRVLGLSVCVAAALAVAGCSTVGDVQRTSQETYTVECSKGGQFWTFGPSWIDVKAMCLKRASETCGVQGKELIVNGWETHGVRGFSVLTAELSFLCAFKIHNEGMLAK
jgi:hypothetical protein